MRVDYDCRQHAVYSSGREPTPCMVLLWTRVFGRYMTVGSTVVDVGSGTGIWSRVIAAELDADVIAVEPSVRMREVAEREHAHPRVR